MFNCHLKCLLKDCAVIRHNKKLTRYGNRHEKRIVGFELISVRQIQIIREMVKIPYFLTKQPHNLQFLKKMDSLE